MCVPVLGLIVSAVGTVAGISQAQQSMDMQAQQQQQQLDLQYQQAQQQAYQQNKQVVADHKGRINQEIASRGACEQQLQNNNSAANKVYVQEQAKLKEVRDKAAFQAQANYAKAIGAQGKVLATGATGQSVGLLMNDAERQQASPLQNRTPLFAVLNLRLRLVWTLPMIRLSQRITNPGQRLPAPTQAPCVRRQACRSW